MRRVAHVANAGDIADWMKGGRRQQLKATRAFPGVFGLQLGRQKQEACDESPSKVECRARTLSVRLVGPDVVNLDRPYFDFSLTNFHKRFAAAIMT